MGKANLLLFLLADTKLSSPANDQHRLATLRLSLPSSSVTEFICTPSQVIQLICKQSGLAINKVEVRQAVIIIVYLPIPAHSNIFCN
jgi:hypothetical protein